jgi:hypothetical protein
MIIYLLDNSCILKWSFFKIKTEQGYVRKVKLNFLANMNMNFGFGIQFSFVQFNMSAIYKYLGADEGSLPCYGLLDP